MSWARIDNFLAPELHRSILDFVISSEAKFRASVIVTDASDRRRSKVLTELPMAQLFFNHLAKVLDPVCDGLQVARIPQWMAELEIAATEDGGFYRRHTDTGVAPEMGSIDGPVMDGIPDVRRRVLSYVYYLQPEPRPFEGGFLRIHTNTGHSDIEPTGNSIVFFASGSWHEILPTRVPSERFCDSRFTINGWIKRSAVRTQ